MRQLPRHDASDSDRLMYAETTLLNLYERLYGNGHPGDIDRLQSDITEIKQKLDDLDKFRWKIVGAFGLIALLPTIVSILHRV